MTAAPNVVIIAGPNGSGKTTAAPELLRDHLGLGVFVNADTIALGLSGFDAETAAFSAGRIMLGRLRDLAAARMDFAFETTLASRTFAPWLKQLKAEGYCISLFFLFLPSPEMAISRVAARVRRGGHHVDPQVVTRRYHRGLPNLFTLYLPLADEWALFDNAGPGGYQLIASREGDGPIVVADRPTWDAIRRGYA